MQIAVVEPLPDGKLTDMVRDGLQALGLAIDVLPMEPRICLGYPLPRETALAFLRINSMLEVEIARQLAHFQRDIPMIFVSESPEYGMEGFRLGAIDYLLEPLSPGDVAMALRRGLWVKELCDEAGGDLP